MSTIMRRLPPASLAPLVLRWIRAAAMVVALAMLAGSLACWPSPDEVDAGEASIRVEVRDDAGVGVAAVPLELRGLGGGSDSSRVYARRETGADGRATLGPVKGLSFFRLFVTVPAGYALGPGQTNPIEVNNFNSVPPPEPTRVLLTRQP